MKLVLLKDVPKVGRLHDLIQVKPGFARNFLLPRGFATPATAGLIKSIELSKKKAEETKLKFAEQAKQIAQKLKNLQVTIQKKVSPKGLLYGSVTAKELIPLVEKEIGIKLATNLISFPETVKKIGKYKVIVTLSPETEGHFTLVVKA